MNLGIGVGIAVVVTASLVAQQGPPAALAPAPETAREVHLSNVTQLTFGGENAEAYFSSDGEQLIFQSTRDEPRLRPDLRDEYRRVERAMVSTATVARRARTFQPDRQAHALLRRRYLGGKACPPRPDFSNGYVWAIYDGYDIFTAKPDGTNITRLTTTPGYDAEATIRPTARNCLHVSARRRPRYLLDGRGRSKREAAHDEFGHDGGPFFSPDGKQIVFRGRIIRRPEAEIDDYQDALEEGLCSSDRS